MKKPYRQNLHQQAGGNLFHFANELRRNATPEEELFWERLRNRKLNGWKFRRQHPVCFYVVDFYCHEKRLVVELDGAAHRKRMDEAYDEQRNNELLKEGMNVIRFWNSDVTFRIEWVLEQIVKAATERT